MVNGNMPPAERWHRGQCSRCGHHGMVYRVMNITSLILYACRYECEQGIDEAYFREEELHG